MISLRCCEDSTSTIAMMSWSPVTSNTSVTPSYPASSLAISWVSVFTAMLISTSALTFFELVLMVNPRMMPSSTILWTLLRTVPSDTPSWLAISTNGHLESFFSSSMIFLSRLSIISITRAPPDGPSEVRHDIKSMGKRGPTGVIRSGRTAAGGMRCPPAAKFAESRCVRPAVPVTVVHWVGEDVHLYPAVGDLDAVVVELPVDELADLPGVVCTVVEVVHIAG